MSYRREAAEEIHHTLEKWGIVKPTPDEKAIDDFKLFRYELLKQLPAGGIRLNLELMKYLMQESKEKLLANDQTDPRVQKLKPKDPPFPTLDIHLDQDRFDLVFAQPTHELFRTHPNRNIPEITKEGISILRNSVRIIEKNSSYPLPLLTPLPENTITPRHPTNQRFAVMFALWAIDPKTSKLDL
jgi:hypothetical protein